MKRITGSFPDDMAEEIESYSDRMGITKSALLSIAVREYLDQKKMVSMMPDVLKRLEETEERRK